MSIIALNWCCLLWNIPGVLVQEGPDYCSRDTAQVATLIRDPGLHKLFEGSVFYERIIFWQVWWIWIFLNARVGQGPLYPYRRIAAVVVVPRPWFIPAIAESLQTYFLQDTAAHKFCEGEIESWKEIIIESVWMNQIFSCAIGLNSRVGREKRFGWTMIIQKWSTSPHPQGKPLSENQGKVFSLLSGTLW